MRGPTDPWDVLKINHSAKSHVDRSHPIPSYGNPTNDLVLPVLTEDYSCLPDDHHGRSYRRMCLEILAAAERRYAASSDGRETGLFATQVR